MRTLILLLIFCLSLNQASAQLLDNLRLGLESNMAWYNDDKRTGAFFDEENNEHYYWIYYFKNDEVKIIGKSSVKPQCYRQIARYVK